MKKDIQSILFTIFVGGVLFSLVLAYFYEPEKGGEIDEEAVPIREEDFITGMDYYVTIGKKVKDSNLLIPSHIIDSILHYKDVDSIDNFLVQLTIDNQSKSPYLLKGIHIMNKQANYYIEDISYEKDSNNRFVFYLSKDFFQEYDSKYSIQIELER